MCLGMPLEGRVMNSVDGEQKRRKGSRGYVTLYSRHGGYLWEVYASWKEMHSKPLRFDFYSSWRHRRRPYSVSPIPAPGYWNQFRYTDETYRDRLSIHSYEYGLNDGALFWCPCVKLYPDIQRRLQIKAGNIQRPMALVNVNTIVFAENRGKVEA